MRRTQVTFKVCYHHTVPVSERSTWRNNTPCQALLTQVAPSPLPLESRALTISSSGASSTYSSRVRDTISMLSITSTFTSQRSSWSVTTSRARMMLLRRIGWVDSATRTALWEHEVPFSYKGWMVTASWWVECLPRQHGLEHEINTWFRQHRQVESIVLPCYIPAGMPEDTLQNHC